MLGSERNKLKKKNLLKFTCYLVYLYLMHMYVY